jgi:hypothetical protein
MLNTILLLVVIVLLIVFLIKLFKDKSDILPLIPSSNNHFIEENFIQSDEKKRNLFIKLRNIYSEIYKYNLTVYNFRVCLFCDALKGHTMGLRGYPGTPSSEGLISSINYWISLTREDLKEIKNMLKDERTITFLNKEKNQCCFSNLYKEIISIRTQVYVTKFNYIKGLQGIPGFAGLNCSSNYYTEIIEYIDKVLINIQEDLDSIQVLIFQE